jgi:hypothetical protein
MRTLSVLGGSRFAIKYIRMISGAVSIMTAV